MIGLGDRHGSNILVDQLTWGALHIDFGDVCTIHCPQTRYTDSQLFGVAQDRSFLPEKVPFRLTEMMTNCFELADRKHDKITESRGNFIKSSVVTMEVMRENADILLAMLEAFLYDPLLSWTVRCIPDTFDWKLTSRRMLVLLIPMVVSYSHGLWYAGKALTR